MIAFRGQNQRLNPVYFGRATDLVASSDAAPFDILLITCFGQPSVFKYASLGSAERCYTVQNMAASVPRSGDQSDVSTLAGIQLAVCELGVQHAIVCGHLACRFVSNPVQGPDMGGRGGDGTSCLEPGRIASASRHERLQAAAQDHLRRQLMNFQSLRFVQEKLRGRDLRLYGWLLDDTAGRVYALNPISDILAPI
jgi:carbonic anhydrase